MSRIVILGPAFPYRGGGITSFNERLAAAFSQSGDTPEIVNFTYLYPSFLFPGKTQFAEDKTPPENIIIHRKINSINPFNWIKVGRQLKKQKPDIVIVRYWLPFLGPALGTILRKVKKNKHTKIICIADNIIPHEKRIGDRSFTKYFLKPCDAFITMSQKVLDDLRHFEKNKPALIVPHPLYDHFGKKIATANARKKLNIEANQKLILFFGFIRKYKGLDLLLQAMTDERIKNMGIKLLIAGEFYDNKNLYQEFITQHQLSDQIILKADFIKDDAIKYYVCAADVVVQPYKNATQSGVTPLAYHFEKPMIVTNVGGLPDMVPHEKSGLVVEPNAKSIADGILHFYELGEAFFIPHLRVEKQKYSWETLVKAIHQLAATGD
ncbi:MAG: glycosyltransferase family 4 protein [Chitinophagaceae bacterium]|nr:glycosyltransferase family 4 protein [Chitinophagaceae bacterium]